MSQDTAELPPQPPSMGLTISTVAELATLRAALVFQVMRMSADPDTGFSRSAELTALARVLPELKPEDVAQSALDVLKVVRAGTDRVGHFNGMTVLLKTWGAFVAVNRSLGVLIEALKEEHWITEALNNSARVILPEIEISHMKQGCFTLLKKLDAEIERAGKTPLAN
jgi:hypothetical protein